MMLFSDRLDAGRRLAARLGYLRGDDVVVVGLPRGGVPVAFEVARALGAPLDVLVVRKLGVPFQPEVAMGAIGEDGARVLDGDVLRNAGVTAAELAEVEAAERVELERRVRRFRGGRPAVPLAGRTVVVVDDGIATGSTVRAACRVARGRGAARVVLAVPVAPSRGDARLSGAADDLVFLERPEPFFAVGQWYDDFSQTTDDEVVAYLERAASLAAAQLEPPAVALAPADDPPLFDEEVTVPAGPVRLAGRLFVPEHLAAWWCSPMAAPAAATAHGTATWRGSSRPPGWPPSCSTS